MAATILLASDAIAIELRAVKQIQLWKKQRKVIKQCISNGTGLQTEVW